MPDQQSSSLPQTRSERTPWGRGVAAGQRKTGGPSMCGIRYHPTENVAKKARKDCARMPSQSSHICSVFELFRMS
eukprot:6468172-Amphidinium_carterae.1